MNNKYTMIIVSLCVVTVMGACKKSELPIDESFTDCENCTFIYEEEEGRLVFSYREYWDEVYYGGSPYSELEFTVPSDLTTFDYGPEEIASDDVTYFTICINCGTIPLQPVGGEIVGKKVAGNKWLVEANVFLEGPPNLDTRDTIAFKQYFTKGAP